MAEESSIGLAELIAQVKQELLQSEFDDSETLPLFSVDAIELELQVTVQKEGRAGLSIKVVELGGGSSRDDVQRVTVTLSPLLSKEARIARYQQHFPQKWEALSNQVVAATVKGSDEDLDAFYDDEG